MYRAFLPAVAGLIVLGLVTARLVPAQEEPPADAQASLLLGLLPDSPEKRKFILDCMGCHSLNRRILYPEGILLDEAAHKASVDKMLSFSGANTMFPVMSPERDADATAAFLAKFLTEANVERAVAATPAINTSPKGYTVTEWDLPEQQDLPHDLKLDGRGSVLVTGMFSGLM